MAETQSGERKKSNRESYTVGQVADSLSCKQTAKGKASPLMLLFSTPSISTSQSFFTPVLERKVSGKKRKIPEDEPAVGKEAKQQKLGKKTVRRKVPTEAEQILAQRERALSAADEDGEGVGGTKQRRKKQPTEDGSLAALETRKVKRRRKRLVSTELEKLKSERTLFVGNLPFEYSKEMITALFKEFGPIESVRFRSVAREEPTISRKLATIQRKVHPQRKNMNAYVVFRQSDAAVKALARNGCEIQTGFNIRVDLASNWNDHNHRRSIFLGNLPYDIQENDVRDHFYECGEVESVRIVRDRESGMGKGFGYVLFQNTDSVTLALELNNSELKGRKVRINRSVKKERVSQDPAAGEEKKGKRMKPAAKDFTGLMAKPVEGKKNKKKNQGKKSNRVQRKTKSKKKK
ncbi:RNA-binding protein 34 isoform X1 [Leucoraja erinacea]|uniref:RNA-binding protein 34 isoform X1 n=1 Tax=Leucoraja erinaceus TaxID=7782 RepID=UPI002455F2DC|nr:RNA-binding protein 34 isoform X1 [Leucoraja erinacea]